MQTLLSKLAALFTRSTANSDAVDQAELEAHLDLLSQRFEQQGLPPAEARKAARRQFGNPGLHHQQLRDQRRLLPLTNLARDLRFAARRLRKSPGFALTAILTLALGIGASTAIFSIVDGVLLKPLAYRNSGQLVALWERVRFLENLFPYVGPNTRHVLTWAEQSPAFSSITLVQAGAIGVSLRPSDHPYYVGSVEAQINLLETLQVQPILGRNFRPEESIKGRNNVALITWQLWQTLFHGDPTAIGHTIQVNGMPIHVIGILPKDFYFPKSNELNPIPRTVDQPAVGFIVPLSKEALNNAGLNSDYGNFVAIGRLKPGVTIPQATAQLDALLANIARQIPPNERGDDQDVITSLHAYIQPLKDAIVGKSTRGLWLLFAAVLSVLFIACINLANAQLARSIARDRESAVRSALGASAWSLLQSSLVEALLLAIAGSTLGIALAWIAVHRVSAYIHLAVARTESLSLNPTVLALSIALTLGATLLFGMLPALRQLRIRPQQALQNSTRTAGNRRGNVIRRWLITVQIFSCTMLLLVAGLFARSFLTLAHSDKGLSTDNVLTATVSLAGDNYPPAVRLRVEDALLAHLRALPGVEAVGLVSNTLFTGESNIDGVGQPNKYQVLANYRYISPGYFAALAEPILHGRELNDHDRSTHSAIISQATANAVFSNGENPIGRPVNHNGVNYTVVGIAADAHNTSLRNDTLVNMVYVGYWDRPASTNVLLIRSQLTAGLLTNAVRKAIWSYDPSLTIASMSTLNQQINTTLSPERLETTILTAFGLSALLLALLGIYGTLSYSVATRRQEIGIRMALGASRASIYANTLREIATPLAAGLILGWLTSLAIGRTIAALLYNTAPTDPAVAASVIALFLIAAAAATILPCRRAATVDPMEALRAE